MVAIIIGSVLFLILFGVVAYFVTEKVLKDVDNDREKDEETKQKLKEEYKKMSIGLSFLGVFCMWLMWISVYMHQLNPLINPVLEKEVVEILSHH